MGKGRDKRRRKAKKQSQQTRDEVARAYAEALATLSSSDPPILGEPDAPVYAPLKPKPNLRSGAIALPEPEPEDGFVTLKPKIPSK
jgi:hypothetical protein